MKDVLMCENGSKIGLSMDFGYRRHNIKIDQLTDSEMTASFLGLISFACRNVSRMAVISVRSANECLVGGI